MKQIRFCIGVILFIFPSLAVLAQENSLILVAHAGYVLHPAWSADIACMYVGISLRLGEDRQLSRIQGGVTQDCGERPFTVLSSSYVQDASISVFPDRVNFDIHLQPVTIPANKEIVNIKPVWGKEDRYYYMYIFRWLECAVDDANGNQIPTDLRVYPAQTDQDMNPGHDVEIGTEGFGQEILSLKIVRMFGEEIYPYTEAIKRGTFFIFNPIYQFSGHSYTYELTFADGTVRRYQLANGYDLILRPASNINCWERFP